MQRRVPGVPGQPQPEKKGKRSPRLCNGGKKTAQRRAATLALPVCATPNKHVVVRWQANASMSSPTLGTRNAPNTSRFMRAVQEAEGPFFLHT